MSRKRRVFRNAGAPEGLVFLNFKSKATLPKADDVPTLSSSAAMAALSDGDAEPFFKVEAIDFPANGSGGVYEGSFFKSFIGVTKERPIPGSKRGHEWASRGKSDFYTVGGKIDSLDNGKTGTAYLKIYMPPKGDETDNVGLIRDAKAGMVHFSLVSRPDFNVKTEKDEMGNPIQVRHFTASVGAERNDAMEYGAGAMAQLVNSLDSLDFDLARSLIAEGKFDRSTKIDGNPLQNGIVYRSALRSMISRANGQGDPELSELLSLIDKSTKQNGGKSVNKEELFAALKNMVANAQTNILEIANALGLGNLVKNEKDGENAKLLEALNAKLGEKPLEAVDAMLAERAVNQAGAIEAAVLEVAGPKVIQNAAKVDIVNPAHAYAVQKCAGLAGEALKNAVEALKKDPVIMALNAQRADGDSPLYRVEAGGARSQNAADDSGDGIPTIKVGGRK